MNKKTLVRRSLPIFVTALLAFSGLAKAQSGIKITGVMDTAISHTQFAGDSGHNGMLSGGMTTPYIGFSGTEDLGADLKVNFALSAYLRSNDGTAGRFNGDPTWARDSWVGLSGNFGAITLGRDMSPNFLPTVRVNPFGDSFGFAPIFLHYQMPGGSTWRNSTLGRTDTGWDNQIRYTTPNLSGMVANVHYQMSGSGDESGRNIGGNLLYDKGPVSVSAFYEDAEFGNPSGTQLGYKQKTWMLGGSYDFSIVKVYASYSQSKISDLNWKDKTATAGVGIPLGKGTIMASWARTERDDPAVADATRNTASIGYDYNLSKRTDIYTVYLYDKVTDTSSGNSFAVGIRHHF